MDDTAIRGLTQSEELFTRDSLRAQRFQTLITFLFELFDLKLKMKALKTRKSYLTILDQNIKRQC